MAVTILTTTVCDSNWPYPPSNDGVNADAYSFWFCEGGDSTSAPPDPSWTCAVADQPATVENRTDGHHRFDTHVVQSGDTGINVTLQAPVARGTIAVMFPYADLPPAIVPDPPTNPPPPAFVIAGEDWFVFPAITWYRFDSNVCTAYLNLSFGTSDSNWANDYLTVGSQFIIAVEENGDSTWEAFNRTRVTLSSVSNIADTPWFNLKYQLNPTSGPGIAISNNVLTIQVSNSNNNYSFRVGDYVMFENMPAPADFLNGQFLQITAIPDGITLQFAFTHADFSMVIPNANPTPTVTRLYQVTFPLIHADQEVTKSNGAPALTTVQARILGKGNLTLGTINYDTGELHIPLAQQWNSSTTYHYRGGYGAPAYPDRVVYNHRVYTFALPDWQPTLYLEKEIVGDNNAAYIAINSIWSSIPPSQDPTNWYPVQYSASLPPSQNPIFWGLDHDLGYNNGYGPLAPGYYNSYNNLAYNPGDVVSSTAGNNTFSLLNYLANADIYRCITTTDDTGTTPPVLFRDTLYSLSVSSGVLTIVTNNNQALQATTYSDGSHAEVMLLFSADAPAGAAPLMDLNMVPLTITSTLSEIQATGFSTFKAACPGHPDVGTVVLAGSLGGQTQALLLNHPYWIVAPSEDGILPVGTGATMRLAYGVQDKDYGDFQQDWSGTTNLAANTGPATIALAPSTYDPWYGDYYFGLSKWLAVRNFGFNIPSDATIQRVAFAFEGSVSSSDTWVVYLENLGLLVGNEISGAVYNNYAMALDTARFVGSPYNMPWPYDYDAFPGADTADGTHMIADSDYYAVTYGNSATGYSNWQTNPDPAFYTSLTPAQVNDPGFGFVLAAMLDGSSSAATANIHSVRMAVYYTVPPPPPPPSGPPDGIIYGFAILASQV